MGNKIRLASSEHQWVLDQPFYSLGRSRTANLKINQSQASRIHIFFFNDPERGVLVGDAGSRHGAYLNGQLILKPEVLVNSDVIDVASEELHVSFTDEISDSALSKPVTESGALLNARFSDKGVDWGDDSTVQSRTVGEWFYRSIKLIMLHHGKVVKVTDRTISAIWEGVNEQQPQKLQEIVECARQMNQFGISLNEQILGEYQMPTEDYLFKSYFAIHYASVKHQKLSNGQLKVLGENLKFMDDLSLKAVNLDSQIVSTDTFPSRSEDRCQDVPMLMAEIGIRRTPTVLYPLRTD